MKKDKNLTYVDFSQPEAAVSAAANPRPVKSGKPPNRNGHLTPAQKTKSVMAVIGTTFLTIFLIAVITFCIVAVALTVYIMQFAENSFDIDLKAVELSFSSFIKGYDKEAGEWVELKQISGDENRVWVDIDDMPQYLIDAIVSSEDHRYFEHDGVDWYRTGGVVVNAMLKGTSEGGSTITQQLVRDVTNDDKINIGRKLREIFRALSLEQKYTKLDILESYLNRIGFGGSSCGVGSAAWYYFGKNVSELTIAESALLAGVIPSPHNYNPYNNAFNAKERQIHVLKECMYAYGYITTAEYEEALAEQVHFRRPIAGDDFGYIDERYNEVYGLQDDALGEEDLYYEDTSWEELRTDLPYKWNGDYEVTQNWYVDAGIWQVATHLAEQRGVSYETALDLIRTGGYTIYLNMDMEIQKKLEEKARDPYTFLSAYNQNAQKTELLQGAFVIMGYDGRVLALAGGIGEKEGDNCFNRATQAKRAIGSTVKPLSVYGPAIDMDILTYSTMTKDISGERKDPNDPNNPDKVEFWPYNYEETVPGTGVYWPTWYAVQKSTNTIAVRTLQKVGFQASFSMLTEKLGITTLDSRWDMNWSPLALGAFTDGVRLYELAAAYQIFGNGGVYYEPYLYEKVVDHNGKVVLEQNLVGTRAIEKDSAWVVNRMMKKVIDDPYGSGQHAKIDNNEIIGKTGTSNDMKNLLFCGLTPEYVAVYRIGYDDGSKEIAPFGSGWLRLASAWRNIMVEICDQTTSKKFTPDSTVVELNYCKETGLLATSKCPSTEIGYFKATNLPKSCDAAEHDGSGSLYWQTHGDPPGFRPQYN